MKFTFGIITNNNIKRVQKQIDSIVALDIPSYEIIVIGCNEKLPHAICLPFNENIKPMWITKKKNLITQKAQFSNIVFSHDYILFDRNWYEGFKKFGNNWNICMTKILDKDGNRFRDWNVLNPPTKRHGKLPYTVLDLSCDMYISGTYWVSKKRVMEEFPLNEELSWGESEDIEWSKRVRKKYTFNINTYSTVKLMKVKRDQGNIMSDKDITILRERK